MQHNIKTKEKQQEKKALIARLDSDLRSSILKARAKMEQETQDVVTMQKVVSDLVRLGLESSNAA